MPDLFHTLQGYDLGFLKIVAQAWCIDLDAPDVHTALPRLTGEMLDANLAGEVINALPKDSSLALEALLEQEGRIPWAIFSRRFGEVRAFGAARRDRERPERNPVSPAEVLWYRGLIGKAFLNLPPEPQEYAYIPDDLLEFMAGLKPSNPGPLGRAASPAETAFEIDANDRILDDCCTLLAAVRTGRDEKQIDESGWSDRLPFLKMLLQAAGLLAKDGSLNPDAARQFLEKTRGEALSQLVTTWLGSKDVNELILVPGLYFSGMLQNDPLATRQSVLGFLDGLPGGVWWNIAAFAAAVREQYPDFQRPGGDYDSWFIQKEGSEEFLRGVSSWEAVDGALLRFFVTGPLHWLGIVELAGGSKDGSPLAFRYSAWTADLLSGKTVALPREQDQIQINPDHRFKLSRLTSRAVRYQIARFCDWEKSVDGNYRYRVTPASLENARRQGLLPAHIVKLLHRVMKQPVPQSLLQALERWDRFGIEAGLQPVTLLRVSSPEILDALRKTRAEKALVETLTPTTVILRPGSEEAVRKVLAELGYLSESSLAIGKRV